MVAEGGGGREGGREEWRDHTDNHTHTPQLRKGGREGGRTYLFEMIPRIFQPGVGEELSGRLAKERLLLEAAQEEERAQVLADAVRREGRGVVLHDSEEGGHGRCFCFDVFE